MIIIVLLIPFHNPPTDLQINYNKESTKVVYGITKNYDLKDVTIYSESNSSWNPLSHLIEPNGKNIELNNLVNYNSTIHIFENVHNFIFIERNLKTDDYTNRSELMKLSTSWIKDYSENYDLSIYYESNDLIVYYILK